MKRGEKEEYVTISIFEKAMRAIAARFDRIESHLKEITDFMTREYTRNREDHEEFRSLLRLHDREITIHDRKIEGLTARVETLE